MQYPLNNRWPLLAVLALSGCIQEVALGPNLGACADYPGTVYTYGEVDIGRCLAGPTDLQFIEQDGEVWLAVSNANPLLDYTSGSVLLIPWSGLDLTRDRLDVSELGAAALPLENYAGGMGWDAERNLLMVSARLSEGATTRSANDKVSLVDLTDPSAPALYSARETIEVRDDPHPIVIDPETDRGYVVNLTDHSVSVVDLAADVPTVIDLSPSAGITAVSVNDADGSGTRAEIYNRQVLDDADIRPDTWTLSWSPEPVRIWTPSGEGQQRHERAGTNFLPSGIGLELDPTGVEGLDAVTDPFVTGEGPAMMWFASGSRFLQVASSDAIGDWSLSSSVGLFNAPEEVAGGPAPVVLNEAQWLYFHSGDGTVDGVRRAVFDGSLWSIDNSWVLEPGTNGADAYRHPNVFSDPNTGTPRLWASERTGSEWRIVTLTDATDEEAVPEAIVTGTTAPMAAPIVVWNGTHYSVYASVWNGTEWEIHRGTSVDGYDWGDLSFIAATDVTDLSSPPRVAVQTLTDTGWLMEGYDSGLQEDLITPGLPFVSSALDMGFQLSHGHSLSGALFGAAAEVGVVAVTAVDVEGTQRLYATLTDAEGRNRIGIAESTASGWRKISSDVIAEGVGGNAGGASAPVVWQEDGTWKMIYSSVDAFGISRMRKATSADGLTWSPTNTAILDDAGDFDTQLREPHSVVERNGQLELWYAGFDGTRWRINKAVRGGGVWGRPAASVGAQLGPGSPGSFDSVHARWPHMLPSGELWYAGNDGDTWSIGVASKPTASDEWERLGQRMAPRNDTWTLGGLIAPMPLGEAGDLYYGGLDLPEGGTHRMGLAKSSHGSYFPADYRPTPGDTLTFRTRRADPDGDAVIELQQTFDGFSTSGIGVSGARLDNDRGWLWITSKLSDYIYAVDVRDDSTGTFEDGNFNNIEAVLVAGSGPRGFRDALPLPGTDLLYATALAPDQLMVFNVGAVLDDDRKDVVQRTPVASFALRAQETPTGAATRFEQAIGGSLLDRDEDEGAETSTHIGGARMALTPDASTLLVAHFRDNSVEVFDLEAGVYGEPQARIANVGEHPYVVRVHPSGDYAVVANYTGEVDIRNDIARSTLAIIDINPESETYLQVVTRVVNQ